MRERVAELTKANEGRAVTLKKNAAQSALEHAEYLEMKKNFAAMTDVLNAAIGALIEYYQGYNHSLRPTVDAAYKVEDLDGGMKKRPDDGHSFGPNLAAGKAIALLGQLVGRMKADAIKLENDEKLQLSEWETINGVHEKQTVQDTALIVKFERELVSVQLDISNFAGALADLEMEVQGLKAHQATLSNGCDFLVENQDMRRQGRTNEIRALTEVKTFLTRGNSKVLAPNGR